jgi:hypothetical protein
MMLDPGWRGGKFSSFNPQRGPDAISRKSLAIFERFIMQTFNAAEISQ